MHKNEIGSSLILLPGFEPGILDSKSRVITTSLQKNSSVMKSLNKIYILISFTFRSTVFHILKRGNIIMHGFLYFKTLLYTKTYQYFSDIMLFYTSYHHAVAYQTHWYHVIWEDLKIRTSLYYQRQNNTNIFKQQYYANTIQ